MALRDLVKKVTRPVEAIDRENLCAFCEERGFAPLDAVVPRRRLESGGEVSSVRIVPRAGAPALEVTFSDGRGSATAVFLGRRRIAGLVPGRRITVCGVAAVQDRRVMIYNPEWSFVG